MRGFSPPIVGQAREAVARLDALHQAGHQYVLISEVLRWLGEDVAEDKPAPVTPPPEDSDPLARLGIKPTTPVADHPGYTG